MDLRTGEPVINPDGDFEEISVQRALNQFLDVLFNTPLGAEALLPHWGLDFQQFVRASTSPNWESVIKYIIIKSLENEPIVQSVESIDLERDSYTLYAEVRVVTEYGTTASPSVAINV